MTQLGDLIRGDLHEGADPERAPAMASYMKIAENGGLPYLGLRRPDVRRIARNRARSLGEDELLAGVLDLWDNAEFHEERYAAQDLLGMRWTSGRLDLLDLHRRMAVTGAWWDHVDEVAHRIGDLLRTHPTEMAPVLRSWSHDPDRWVRRLAILGSLGSRDRTDLDLLRDVIEPNTADKDFFIRKAIGWALRDAARTHPDWVRAFVAGHDLSGLSRREALKHLE